MTRAVHIVALAARTPVGLTAESAAAAVRAGISRVGEHPFMVDATGDKLVCAHDRLLDPALFGMERAVVLTRAALHELTRKLSVRAPLPQSLPVLLALPDPRPGFGPDRARVCQMRLAAEPLDGIELAVERCGDGHAGALRALEVAAARVAQGQHDLCIAGGADSYLDADTLDWLEADRRIAHAEARGGFPPGEGACLIALADNSTRAALGLPSLARIRAVATAQEARPFHGDEGLLGEALSDVIRRVGERLRAGHERFDDIYCDLNGERARTDDWTFTLLRTSQLFRDGTVYATSTGQCGDLGAASAAFHCALAVRAFQRGYARGPLGLVWGASWAGLRGAVALEESRG